MLKRCQLTEACEWRRSVGPPLEVGMQRDVWVQENPPPAPRTAVCPKHPSTAASWADGLCSVCANPKDLHTCFPIEATEMHFSRLLLSRERAGMELIFKKLFKALL